MTTLREEIETDLGITLESDFQVPVHLTAPTGSKQTMSKNDPSKPLVGMVLYDYRRENADGQIVIVPDPVVTLRISSLDRVPIFRENWIVEIPQSPKDSTMTPFSLSRTHAPEGGKSIGFIRLYLQNLTQSA